MFISKGNRQSEGHSQPFIFSWIHQVSPPPGLERHLPHVWDLRAPSALGASWESLLWWGAGPPHLLSRHHLFVNSTQHSSRALTAMTTATSTGVIKRNLIILIKNSTANSVTGLGSWSNSRVMPLWDVVGPRSWTQAHHCCVARSDLKVISIQYQRSARMFF